MTQKSGILLAAAAALFMLLAATVGAQHGAYRACVRAHVAEAATLAGVSPFRLEALERQLARTGRDRSAREWAAQALATRCSAVAQLSAPERGIVQGLWGVFTHLEEREAVLTIILARSAEFGRGLPHTQAAGGHTGPLTDPELKCLLKTRNGDVCSLSLGASHECPAHVFQRCERRQSARFGRAVVSDGTNTRDR